MAAHPASAASAQMQAGAPRLRVREMRLAEVDVRIDYFHSSSGDYLRTLGVDRSLLPSRAAWRESCEADYSRPIQDRDTYSLIWELDDQVVGFSSTDHITFGEQAFMHLHILDPAHRRSGLGAQFVRRSAATYFHVLELQRLYCQPNAFNVAPNRTLQAAGFRYVFTREMATSELNPFNFPQPVTRWVLEKAPA
jgi:RimJ/RimL family protein N-acetyltransferase